MSVYEGLPHEQDEYRRRQYEALSQQLRAIETQYDARPAASHTTRPTLGPRHKRLMGTPQGLQVLRETIDGLLAAGELWWSKTP